MSLKHRSYDLVISFIAIFNPNRLGYELVTAQDIENT